MLKTITGLTLTTEGFAMFLSHLADEGWRADEIVGIVSHPHRWTLEFNQFVEQHNNQPTASEI